MRKEAAGSREVIKKALKRGPPRTTTLVGKIKVSARILTLMRKLIRNDFSKWKEVAGKADRDDLSHVRLLNMILKNKNKNKNLKRTQNFGPFEAV